MEKKSCVFSNKIVVQALGHQLAITAIISKANACSKCEAVNIESVECAAGLDNILSGILSIMIVHYAHILIICCVIVPVLSHSFPAVCAFVAFSKGWQHEAQANLGGQSTVTETA